MAPEAPQVVKLMTISRAEFAASLATLDPGAELDANGTASFRIGAHTVLIRYEQLPKLRLGGIISLPQARVTLDFSPVPEAARASVLRAFEIAFQRGGG